MPAEVPQEFQDEPESDEYRQAIIEAEAHEREHGYTLGAFNEYDHTFIESNAGNPSFSYLASNHLEWREGLGTRKTEERDCLRCLDSGLNNGKWKRQ